MQNRSLTVRAARAGMALAALALTACWPAPGQNPDRTGHNPGESDITPATVAGLALDWEAEVDLPRVGDPVLSSRRVHVTDGHFAYGFDTRTGARRWQAEAVANPGHFVEYTSEAAFVQGDELLVSSSSPWRSAGAPHSVFAFDVATGEGGIISGTGGFVVQSVRGDRAAGTWAILDGSGTESSHLYEKSGDQYVDRGWTDLSYDGLRTTIGPDAIYAAGDGILPPLPWEQDPPGGVDDARWGFGLRAYPFLEDAIDCPIEGAPADVPPMACPLWAAALDGQPATSPVLAPGGPELYVGTLGGHLYAVDRADGSTLWSATLPAGAAAPPALAGDTLYVATQGGTLLAFDAGGCGAATCDPLWTADTGGGVDRQPAVAGGLVHTASADGALRAFDAGGCGAATCAPLWSTDVGAGVTGAPAVSGGRLYVGTDDGRLLSYALT